VKLLLERKDIQVNLASNSGWTSLIWACREGNEDVVKLLLKREDIDIRLKDHDGRTAYDHCHGISDAIEDRLKP
jgi:ankyrin repeat protein